METKDDNYQAVFKLTTTSLEITGSENFVNQQLQNNESLLNAFIGIIKQGFIDKSNLLNTQNIVESNNAQMLKNGYTFTDYEDISDNIDPLQKFEDVIAMENGTFQVLVSIPGSTESKKIVNITLMYLWVKAKTNTESVNASELKKIFELHGLDQSNHFSKYIKNNKKFFITNGSGHNWTIKATVPALKEAEILLNNLKK